ncbi:MAG: lysylphosphatidylglycerol synthase transmembrane domain-containing protein [Zhongshania sp.]|uniref:lysylphosphatidylglycerol synthase transmembrane domain-containing protein n=1 Tax=Zhongshania sp. TaxID=1971902 RepID=UPI0026139331|nr:lysylphosphatidylglycerol synthase transmembrane domain-containing protein [Zhongshania sp.]MDF1693424.1 lysylphosphatidylglycerol synthase transmembrane domain-containing protein [Zhongshania sp.]
MPKSLRWFLASAILIAGLFWVEHTLGWQQVLRPWLSISSWYIFALSLLTLISYALRAQRVFDYFGKAKHHRFTPYLRISLLHNALNNFLPMRLGEASFPLLMKREFSLSMLHSSSGLLFIRLCDLHFLLCLLTISLGFSLSISRHLVVYSAITALLGLPLLLFRFSRPLLNLLPVNWQTWLRQIRPFFPSTSRQCLRIYAHTIAIWCSKLLALAMVMRCFIDIPLQQALLAVVSADLSSVLPVHGLAGSGTFEAAILLALAPFELSHDATLLAALNVHLYLLASSLLPLPLALLLRRLPTGNKSAMQP